MDDVVEEDDDEEAECAEALSESSLSAEESSEEQELLSLSLSSGVDFAERRSNKTHQVTMVERRL